ncbi:MAG: hypothetical protein IT310_10065 [Anaerolineales bacterium]|nr:hypothetical protein [Anaerolineales bacterium]
MTKITNGKLSASFRDPSGFLFSQNGVLYRQINRAYAEDYARLMDSGLYAKLVKAGLLIPHVETDQPPAESEAAFKVIQPERIPFISYPYEWSFGQLQEAALATLSIQKRALKLGMILKDASAYNVQFVRGKATLMDTLSFEIYKAGEPWTAYKQFCQHFLAPLALMSHCDVRLNQLLKIYIDGVPLDLASSLLPFKTKFNFGLFTHIHLHANSQRKYSGKAVEPRTAGMNQNAMLGLIESLEKTIQGLTWQAGDTEWGAYYTATNYSDSAFEHKKQLIRAWVAEHKPALVWDLGGNTGVFSREAAASGAMTVSFDLDPAAVEQNYRLVKKDKEQTLLPLVLDLTNPSPALGWNHAERASLLQRGPADLALALAVIHHLAISNNVPLLQVAEFFASCAQWLIVEFVPKSDSQVQRLLASRKDIFPEYTQAGFEAAFQEKFKIYKTSAVQGSERRLYLMSALPK